MVYQLLLLICLFCGLIGYALGKIEATIWSLPVYMLAAIVSLQVVYLVTLIMKA